MSLVAAGTVLTVVHLGSASGRVVAGWIADCALAGTFVLTWIAWLLLGYRRRCCSANAGSGWACALPMDGPSAGLRQSATRSWACRAPAGRNHCRNAPGRSDGLATMRRGHGLQMIGPHYRGLVTDPEMTCNATPRHTVGLLRLGGDPAIALGARRRGAVPNMCESQRALSVPPGRSC